VDCPLTPPAARRACHGEHAVLQAGAGIVGKTLVRHSEGKLNGDGEEDDKAAAAPFVTRRN